MNSRLRSQKVAVLYAGLMFLVVLFTVQIWLLSTSLESYLGGEGSVVVPTVVISWLCFSFSCGILKFILDMDKKA